MYISRARNRFKARLLLLAFVTRLSHNGDVTKSSSHLAERIPYWLRLTAVWPASCLTIVGKHRETGSKHRCIHLLTQPGHRGQSQQGERAQVQEESCVSYRAAATLNSTAWLKSTQKANSNTASWSLCLMEQLQLSLLCVICLLLSHFTMTCSCSEGRHKQWTLQSMARLVTARGCFLVFGSNWTFFSLSPVVRFLNWGSPTTYVNLSYACACSRPANVFM